MRRRARDLWAHATSLDAIDAAITLTTRGKRRHPDVAWLLFRRAEVTHQLHAALRDGAWAPAPFRLHQVRDPKPRAIAVAPIEDRVVHTALVKAMEPTLAATLTHACAANRVGYGTHRAAVTLLGHARRHRYALHLDVRAYFPSIDLTVLRGLLTARIADDRFLGLLDQVFDVGAALYADLRARAWLHLTPDWPPVGRGLPVGAYTSQILASWLYLDALDHHLLRRVRVPAYLRYVDDLVLFADDRATLERARAFITDWLADERGLRLKHPDAPILSTAHPVDALGHRITRDGLAPRPRILRRLRRRVTAHLLGHAPVDPRAVASSAGLWMFGA